MKILVVDDEKLLVKGIKFNLEQDGYAVVTAFDGEEAIRLAHDESIDLILLDLMLPKVDGFTVCRTIRSFSNVPIIMVTAKSEDIDKILGLEYGADDYITKPFSVRYLEKVVERLIKRKEDLKQYFSSAVSSFEINEGKLVHEEDKKFMEKVYQVIDSNITNPELSIETISSSLGYSTRQFYRRIKEITPKKPNDIIREYKLDIVKKLLINTNLSVEEIMDRTGFINRGNFFKIFSQKFEMTPKKYREQMRKDITKTNLENS